MAAAILIVDDEPTLVKNVSAFLARHGYDTAVATSGEEALGQLDTFKPDIVLLDFHLPGIDGVETLKRIVAQRPETRVIMITGHSNVRVAVDAMKAGAFDYIVKPLVLGELRLLLERCAGQERMEQALHYYTRRQAHGAA